MGEITGIVAYTKALLSKMEMLWDKTETALTTEQACYI